MQSVVSGLYAVFMFYSLPYGYNMVYMEKSATTAKPIAQKVRWKSEDEEGNPGLVVESDEGVDFISWSELSLELERELLIQLGRVLGEKKYKVETGEFKGRKNWLVALVDEGGNKVGSVWLGGDPYNNWRWDGLVRVGKALDDQTARVWQIFERYSDGSYRRVEALDTPEDRII